MDGKLRAGKIAARESRNLDQKFSCKNCFIVYVQGNIVPCFRRIYCTFFAFLVFNACYIHISHDIFGMFL